VYHVTLKTVLKCASQVGGEKRGFDPDPAFLPTAKDPIIVSH
jgi:hypothetical protein